MAAIVVLPVLYVLSSGPLHGVAFRDASIVGFDPDGIIVLYKPDDWWAKVYAPLIWASERPWGRPLRRYWNFIETRSARD
jgi:hypothetical protein